MKNIIKSVKHDDIIKSMKQKYGMNPYMDDATEKILPICKCLQSIMPVPNISVADPRDFLIQFTDFLYAI